MQRLEEASDRTYAFSATRPRGLPGSSENLESGVCRPSRRAACEPANSRWYGALRRANQAERRPAESSRRSAFVSFNRAHDEACQVVFAGLIHARHFSGLATDQERSRCACSPEQCPRRRLPQTAASSFADREVIEEKERLRALYRDIVHAVIDQIFADGVVTAGHEGELQFRTNAIGRTDQNRIAPALQVKPAPKLPMEVRTSAVRVLEA